MTIGKQTLSKQGTYNPETNGGRYPFKITLNELGEDLVSGSDAITLVDDLSDTLILDTTSIRVKNTRTGETVTNWTSSVDGQTLKIVLPDALEIIILLFIFAAEILGLSARDRRDAGLQFVLFDGDRAVFCFGRAKIFGLVAGFC